MQKYHFFKENYQHVKVIAKQMRHEKTYKTYGEKCALYVNWPQVYGYKLAAKIYDLNAKESPDTYWIDIESMIREDKHVVVEGKKYSIKKLKNAKLLNTLQMNSAKTLKKLK